MTNTNAPYDDYDVLDALLFVAQQIENLEKGKVETIESMNDPGVMHGKFRRLTIKDADAMGHHMKFHVKPAIEYLQHKLNQ